MFCGPLPKIARRGSFSVVLSRLNWFGPRKSQKYRGKKTKKPRIRRGIKKSVLPKFAGLEIWHAQLEPRIRRGIKKSVLPKFAGLEIWHAQLESGCRYEMNHMVKQQTMPGIGYSNAPFMVLKYSSRYYRHFTSNGHFSVHIHDWLFPLVPSDCTGTIAGNRH